MIDSMVDSKKTEANLDPKTEACHGTVSLIRVKGEPSEKVTEKVNRKRTTQNKNATIKKVFLCDKCDYGANDKYLKDRHMKRIHDNSLDRIKCTFCSFSTIYSFSIKRHMLRYHTNKAIQTPVPVSDSSSCLTTTSRSRISQMPVSDTSSYVTTISQKNKAAQTSRSDVSSFWDM